MDAAAASLVSRKIAALRQDGPLLFAVAFVYFAAAKIGLSLAVEAPQISAVWPPTGIALAAALRFGARVLPGVFAGAFAANATVEQPLWIAGGIAVGNSLEALIGAYLLTRLSGDGHPVRVAVSFMAAAAVAPIVSAGIGVGCLVAGGVYSGIAFFEHLRVWWVGDALGALVLAPALSRWEQVPPMQPRLRTELGLLVAAAALACAVVFYGSSRLPFTEYVVFPFIVLAAMRTTIRGTAVVVVACDAVAVMSTYHGFGPFAGLGPERGLLHLQIFVAVAAATGLLLAAVAERQRASEQAARTRAHELEMQSHARLQAEQQLRQRDRELTDFLENATVGLHWVAPDGTILWANRTQLDMLAYADGDYVGRNISEFHADADVAQDIRRRLAAGEQLQDYPATMRRKDGSLRDVLVRADVLQENGRIVHARCFTRDVTAEKRVEEALRRSEARFRALMEQAPFSVQIFAPDGKTVQVNRAWEQLWGVTLAEITGYNVLEDPQLAAKGVLPYLQRAFEGEAVSIPAILYDPRDTLPEVFSGEDPVRWVAAVAYPLKDAGGRVREVVLVHEDITARAKAEQALRESEEKLRLLADTIPQLAWMARGDGYIFWYNRQWYEYTGSTPEQMEGWGWQSIDPAVLQEVLERWRRSLRRADPFEMVFPIKAANGEFRPFLTRVNPLRDEKGRILYWFGTSTDISEIKRMEEALRAEDKRKDEFLATLAHELRNPLAPIMNSLEILKIPHLEPSAAQSTRDIIERQARQLVRLVDDLLDVSRVMHGRIELRKEPVDLASMVARAAETAQPLIDARHHRLEISTPEEPLIVSGDPVRLTQAVANLLSNAAKYTEPDGSITVTGKRDGASAVLEVRDTGVGIAPELLPHVFDLFVQGDHSSNRAQGGLGIGLTLAKNLLNMHDGEIEARSSGVGRGAEFIVRLPLVHGKAHTAGVALCTPQESAPGIRVLVVDDNSDAADSLALLLRLNGHDVRVAQDGTSALMLSKQHRPAVVFLDIGMPGMDGYEVARRMREAPETQATVIAALTGWGQREDRARTAAAGFDHHLVKPVSPESLDALIRNIRIAESGSRRN